VCSQAALTPGMIMEVPRKEPTHLTSSNMSSEMLTTVAHQPEAESTPPIESKNKSQRAGFLNRPKRRAVRAAGPKAGPGLAPEREAEPSLIPTPNPIGGEGKAGRDRPDRKTGKNALQEQEQEDDLEPSGREDENTCRREDEHAGIGDDQWEEPVQGASWDEASPLQQTRDPVQTRSEYSDTGIGNDE